MHTYPIRVRFSECDGLGHVNNAVYFVYMEEARTDLFQLFNPSLDLNKWNLIVASAQCQFRKQAAYAEKLEVVTFLSKIGNSSFTVDHLIRNASGETVAEGQVVLVYFDYEQQRSAAIPEAIREQLKSWIQD